MKVKGEIEDAGCSLQAELAAIAVGLDGGV